ncbi:Lrp/AsnC family transcriptional regulator [Halovulum dunhuangense]|uniref:Lrp/AsnC family transcriptional regulator n=1 Tax=Halovulum dunhuangense TaxID=1505036 RepID=A0A849L3N9_9RHOB|nr:Lrp/AsnC family transcriptional regulator [Halovulum dunhuangense]NNU80939.1 Lrp/AsnC family transcriptional regulator [Halovulum dunhuangense]
MQLDATDRHILRLLQEDASRPNAALADAVGVSPGACWRRIERLEGAGVIKGREVRIDPRALGFEVQVFLRVTLDKTAPNAFDAFIAEARRIPYVQSIETLLGRVDIRMDVIARDLTHYQQIYQERILALPHIADIEALMLVSELKNTGALAI